MLFGEKMNVTDPLVLPRTGKVLKNSSEQLEASVKELK